jgi:excisionase family DNA binding protein
LSRKSDSDETRGAVTMAKPVMLSVREVADALSIRCRSVTSLIASGQLRAVDVSLHPGGRATWRIEREELESFLRRRTHSAAPRRRRRRAEPVEKPDYF